MSFVLQPRRVLVVLRPIPTWFQSMVLLACAAGPGEDSVPYAVVAGLEELFEVVGMTLFLATIAEHRNILSQIDT